MNQVKYWRIERRLSQWELALASGIPRWAVQLIETGVRAPSEDERALLASTLGVEITSLFSKVDKNRLQEEK